MKQKLAQKLWELILEDCAATGHEVIWKQPIVKFAAADDPGFPQLREVVTQDHHLPQDYLPNANNVLSWFLPFRREIGRGNLQGKLSSADWAAAYLDTNAMAARVNEKLADYLRMKLGCDAAVPFDAGMIGNEDPRSRWSQRHVAYLAGHGTFGLNNMLISDAGTVGRYFSIVTALEVMPDAPVLEERCLWKKDGSCAACVARCEAGALTKTGFDRFRCLEQCLVNMERYPGADVCGKCIVELPCSYEVPAK